MDTTGLEAACRTSGMLPSAVEDGLRRLTTHFQSQADPTPALMSEQLAVMRETAPHLWPPTQAPDAAGVPVGVPASVWRGLSPSTKLAWAREHQPVPVVQRRPPPVVLSAAQAAALAAMPPAARLAAYRTLQAEQQQP